MPKIEIEISGALASQLARHKVRLVALEQSPVDTTWPTDVPFHARLIVEPIPVRKRIRPYNDDEMKALAGRPLKLQSGSIFPCGYLADLRSISVGPAIYPPAQLLAFCEHPDGSPCGVEEEVSDV